MNQRQYESFAAAIATLSASLDDPDGDDDFADVIARQYTADLDQSVEERLNGAMTLALILLLKLEDAGFDPRKVLQDIAMTFHPR